MERTIYRSFDELPAVLTAVELAAFLGVSQSGAYNLMHSEGYPTRVVGRRVMELKEELLIWCEEHNDTGIIY